MFKINPYRPGEGVRPQYLAGRDEDIENVTNMFTALTLNIPTQSVIFSGLRGVGKTVLINRLQEIAEEKNIFCKHIEVAERNDFISQIATCSQAFLRQISVKEKFKNLIKKPLDAIKSLVVSFDPNDNTFSLSLEEKDLYKTNNLTQSLTDVFTSLGEAAAKAEIPICFFIDEIQYIKSENLGALIAAIHRTNQLGYPIMIIAAGLPKIYSMLSSEKSYSERLFIYKEIDSLEREQAIKAIEMPIKQFNVKYSDKDVENNLEEFLGKLDTGFFKLRYERCSAAEKKFIFAMVKCGELPCTIANIAEIMKKSINSVSTARAQLINKGIIYPVKYRELDFTVSQFSGFIHRLEEYKQWDTI